MSDERTDRLESAEPATTAFGITANRRDVLRTATGLVAAAAVGGAFLATGDHAAAAAPAPNRIMVKFDTFQGPFEVSSWQYGLGNSVSTAGGGIEVGKASFSELTVTKPMDTYTAKLQLALAKGTKFDEVEIRFIKDSKTVGYILLKEVFVTGSSLSHGGGDPYQAVESVSLQYGEIEFKFAGSSYGWSVMENREV